MSLINTNLFAIITFGSTAHAIAGEQALIEANIENLVLPLPTAISASCGLAIRVYPADEEACGKILINEKLDFQIYLGIKNGKQETYEPIK